MSRQTKTNPETDTAIRINCGVDFQPHQGFGAYSAMVRVGDEQLDPISGFIDEDATFIRCCLGGGGFWFRCGRERRRDG